MGKHSTSNDIKFELVSKENWNGIRSAWSQLAAADDSSMSYFSWPIWVENWVHIYKPNSVYLLLGWHSKKLVFVLPIILKKHFLNTRVASPIGFPQTGYSYPLFAAHTQKDALLKAAIEYLQASQKADALWLPATPENVCWLPKMHHHSFQSPAVMTTMIDTNAPTAVSKGHRKRMLKKWRKINEQGAANFEKITASDSNNNSLISKMIDWKIHWLKEQGRFGAAVRDENFERFVRLIMSASQKTHEAPFYLVLSQEKTPIAAALFLPDQHRLHCLFSAFDPNFHIYSPGQLLIDKSVEWISNSSWRYYDFMGYPEPYKIKFSNVQHALFDYVFPFNLKGKAFKYMQRADLRTRSKKAFYILPKFLRSKLMKA